MNAHINVFMKMSINSKEKNTNSGFREQKKNPPSEKSFVSDAIPVGNLKVFRCLKFSKQTQQNCKIFFYIYLSFHASQVYNI